MSALVKVDTTNPPGNETACCEVLAEILARDGIDSEILEPEQGRGSLIARLQSDEKDKKPAVLLLSHLDVVGADPAEWDFGPFSGDIKDGFVHGRGTLDCKGATVVETMALLELKRSGKKLNRDIILGATADEEAGGHVGVEWLLKEHRDKFFAPLGINEGGGFIYPLRGRNIYSCQCAEKGIMWMKLTSKGEPGHASMPTDDNAMNNLIRALERLTKHRSQARLSETMKALIETISANLGPFGKPVGRVMTTPRAIDFICNIVRDPTQKRLLWAMFHNTFSITMINGGSKTNVIPSVVEATVDCRFIPGIAREEAMEEVRDIVGPFGVTVEPIESSPGAETGVDSELYEAIEASVADIDPKGRMIPFLVPGATDGRFLVEQGAKIYGFIPIKPQGDLKETMNSVHGRNEKISIDNLEFGSKLILDILEKLCVTS